MEKKLILFAGLAILLVIAFVVIIVGKANKPPTAASLSVRTLEETPTSITLAGSDLDNDPLTYSIITEPSHGRLTGTVPNLNYRPEPDFNGQDGFTFEVSDGTVDSAVATVSITVLPGNDPPTANDDTAVVDEDVPIVMIDVLKNDTDPDKDRLVVISATQGRSGSVTINTDSKLTYAPKRNFSGNDTFSYTMSDGKDGTDTAFVNVTVNAVNDEPSITSKPVETARVWAPYTYTVVAKDPDLGDRLIYSLTKKPEGMTIDEATGLIEWRPTSSQAGTYDVTVRVADNYRTRGSDNQEFTITVASLESPLKNILTVTDCFNQKGKDKFSAKDKISVVQTRIPRLLKVNWHGPSERAGRPGRRFGCLSKLRSGRDRQVKRPIHGTLQVQWKRPKRQIPFSFRFRIMRPPGRERHLLITSMPSLNGIDFIKTAHI